MCKLHCTFEGVHWMSGSGQIFVKVRLDYFLHFATIFRCWHGISQHRSLKELKEYNVNPKEQQQCRTKLNILTIYVTCFEIYTVLITKSFFSYSVCVQLCMSLLGFYVTSCKYRTVSQINPAILSNLVISHNVYSMKLKCDCISN